MIYDGLIDKTVSEIMEGKLECGDKDRSMFFIPKLIMEADFGGSEINAYKKRILLNAVIAPAFKEFKEIQAARMIIEVNQMFLVDWKEDWYRYLSFRLIGTL